MVLHNVEKISTSSMNKLCETKLFQHIFTGLHVFFETNFLMCRLKEFIARIKSSDDKGHPWRRPLSAEKKGVGIMLMITE